MEAIKRAFNETLIECRLEQIMFGNNLSRNEIKDMLIYNLHKNGIRIQGEDQ